MILIYILAAIGFIVVLVAAGLAIAVITDITHDAPRLTDRELREQMMREFDEDAERERMAARRRA